jgi:hypothetical protein
MNTFLPRIAIVILIACILVACGAVPSPAPTQIPPTVELVASTPQPSRTPLPPPTRRPSQTPTPPPTQSPSQTPYPTEVDFAKATIWAPFSTCNGLVEDERLLSPKKNWYICGAYSANAFKVINRNGTSWSFSAQKQFGFEYYGNIYLVHWTADENFLYVSVNKDGGDGPNQVNANAEALLRMDLSNGKVSVVLGSVSQTDLPEKLYVVSISPPSRHIAYSIYGSSPQQLYIIDLQSGDKKVIDIDPEYQAVGNFAWSPNGQQLVYKLYTPVSEKDGYCTYTYSIRLLNLGDFSSTTFVKNASINLCESDLPEFYVVEISASEVVLKRRDEIWTYDVKSQRLELQSTVTPSP